MTLEQLHIPTKEQKNKIYNIAFHQYLIKLPAICPAIVRVTNILNPETRFYTCSKAVFQLRANLIYIKAQYSRMHAVVPLNFYVSLVFRNNGVVQQKNKNQLGWC